MNNHLGQQQLITLGVIALLLTAIAGATLNGTAAVLLVIVCAAVAVVAFSLSIRAAHNGR